MENAIARPQSHQYKIDMVCSSHGPVFPFPTPYWLMLIKIVPKLMMAAGMKRLSVGWRKEALKVLGK